MPKLDHYFDTQNCVDRLMADYRKHNNLIVGCDFDDTVFDFHKKGHTFNEVISLLRDVKLLTFTSSFSQQRRKKDIPVR